MLSADLIAFYRLDRFLKDNLFLYDFLDKFQLDDLIDIIILIEELFVDKERERFIEIRGQPQLLEHNDIKWIASAEIPNYDFCPADVEILKKI